MLRVVIWIALIQSGCAFDQPEPIVRTKIRYISEPIPPTPRATCKPLKETCGQMASCAEAAHYPHLHLSEENQPLDRTRRAAGSASKRSMTGFGSLASCATISAISIWRPEPCNPSTTPSARGCHLCLNIRYVPLP